MSEVEKFFHCRLTSLFEAVMINMRVDFVGKKSAPIFIDLTLPKEKSRAFKTKAQLENLPEGSKEI